MSSETSNVITFPLTQDDRLRIAMRRLAKAMNSQAEALTDLRSFLAPLAAAAPPQSTRNKS